MILTFAALAAVLSVFFSRFIRFKDDGLNALTPLAVPKLEVIRVPFHPPSPQDAPSDINGAVMRGYNILMDTQTHAAAFIGNKLSCKNCHFQGGLTQGGQNGGISLVGIGAIYPKSLGIQGSIVDLVKRTNDCFERSLNGKPLHADNPEMLAILAYYQWISKGLPIYEDISWLGLAPLQSREKPDPQSGERIFGQKCVMCHGPSGQGTPAGPPLWGQESFSDGSGLAGVEKLAAFSRSNMPLGNPDLAIQDAMNVAAFIAGRPRPHFPKLKIGRD